MDLKEKVKESGKTVAQIARETGVDPNYLYRKLSEPEWNPGVELAVRLAQSLGTTVEKLWLDGCEKASCPSEASPP